MAEEAVVEQTPEQIAAAQADADAKAASKAMADENVSLKQQLADSKETAQYWHGKAQGAPKPAAEKTDTPADDDPDMLDLIGNKDGAKNLAAWARKQGFATKEEVDAAVEARAAAIVAEADLLRDYPDLNDNTSDFFKDTAKEYGRAIKGGVPKGEAMRVAAERVELRNLKAGGGDKTPDAGKDEEADRVRRIKAQGGDKGSRKSASEDKDELSDKARAIMAEMGVGEKEYRQSRTELRAGQ